MAGAFDVFVILADMRTGSNLLEERLGLYPGLRTYGEVFNPRFMGHEGQEALLGLSLVERDRDPHAAIARMIAAGEGIPGFRLFPGHDPRILAHCLADPRCAKVVLSRNPAESYVSLKIARATGQWWLGDDRTARRAAVRFDAQEFDRFLARLHDFHGEVRRALQTSGQTAFHVHYDDLSDPGVMDGLARWLGATGPATREPKARVQNPESLEAKVENFAEMENALGRMDAFDLYRLPDHEPRRGPNVPAWLAADRPRLIHMPLAGGPAARIRDWLVAAGGAPPLSGWTRKSLHKWMRERPGHRSFTVVTHPVERAFAAFRDRILGTGPDSFPDIRAVLQGRYGLDLPDPAEPDADPARLRAAFLGFLAFLRANLAGQTSVRVPAVWASQAVLVRALSEVVAPDLILRADTASGEVARLWPETPPLGPHAPPPGLARIYDAEIEEAAHAAYPRDYMAFGYGNWA
jgi:LPS sulfotransferase NodH